MVKILSHLTHAVDEQVLPNICSVSVFHSLQQAAVNPAAEEEEETRVVQSLKATICRGLYEGLLVPQ